MLPIAPWIEHLFFFLWIYSVTDMKRKEGKWIRYWADSMVLPYDYTYDLDLEVMILPGVYVVGYVPSGPPSRNSPLNINKRIHTSWWPGYWKAQKL